MDIRNNGIKAHNTSFSGHKKTTDKSGYEKHNFYYLYDRDKYDCEVEFYNISKDKNKKLEIKDMTTPAASLKMENGSVSADMENMSAINSELGFAYRFKLTDKETGEESYAFDNGTVYNIRDTKNTDNKFNIILSNRATINKNGAMQLIMPDEYYPGVEGVYKNSKDKFAGKIPLLSPELRQEAVKNVRNHATKLGGNFYGIIKRLNEIEAEGVTRIVGTPFTKDSISSHLYWTENAYQTAPDLGNEEDFKILQTELFKHGINWIADAALVNEGFGGIHLSELLRKGDSAISKNMFRADERISLGIIPSYCDYTRMKIINAPFTVEDGKYVPGNKNYDPKKPTYIQFYDDRLASEEQKESDSPSAMTTYANKNTDNIYDITKHDDAVYPFPIEVSPYELERNVKRIASQKGKVDFSDISTIKQTADFKNFNVVEKNESGGLEVWDGNVDIAKLNFYRNPQDDARFTSLPQEKKREAIAEFERGTLAVRDYAINSGKYWTALTSDIQLKYASEVLQGKAATADEYMAAIDEAVRAKKLPASALKNIDREVIENVLNDNYNQRIIDSADMRSQINPDYVDGNDYTLNDYILKKSMDVPFETLPFATNLLGIITSPYIAKKAYTPDELGVSRYDISQAGNPSLPEKYSEIYNQTEDIYREKITPMIESVLSEIDEDIKDEDGNITEYGRYVISEVVPDLTKYLLIKSVAPDAKAEVSSKGEFNFTGVNPEEVTMQSIGISYDGMTSEAEARQLVNVINSGLDAISDKDISKLAKAVKARFQNRTLNDFKIAEMILDRTDSGLGWRIDAAKDVASIDAVRSGSASMTETWNNVTDFWKRYNAAVLEINPHAYTTAEITDLYDLFANADKTVFKSDADAEQKFIQDTGITAVANYNYFFSLLPDLFAQNHFEDGGYGWQADQGKNFEITDKLVKGWCEDNEVPNPGFLFQSPDDGVTNSYTFVGNHDKPRILHNLALDMSLFTTDFIMPDYNEPERIKNELKELDDVDLPPEFIEAKQDEHVLVDAQKRYWQNFVPHMEKVKVAADVLGVNIRSVDFDRIVKNIELLNNPETEDLSELKNIITKDDLDKFLTDVGYKNMTYKLNLDKISSKAISMGARLKQAFYEVNGNPGEKAAEEFNKAIAELASGQFKGKPFDCDAFGTRPFEVAIKSVFDQIEYNGHPFGNRREIETKMLESILTPAYDRYYSIFKLLTVLPGSPTDFAGDKVGTTGFESKAKNYHQQNRNIIHWEWLNDENYSFMRKFYDKMNDISALRSKPELSALNDGATVAIPVTNGNQRSEFVQAMLRYNDKDSVVLTLHDLKGANSPFYKKMNRENNEVQAPGQQRIIFDSKIFNAKQGLKHGLTVGTKFKNARDEDDTVYIVAKGSDGYYLRRQNKKGEELPVIIKPEDLNTLVLYKVN